VTFQDESAAREQGTSQGVRKEAEKLKVHLPFRIDSFESELRGFSAFYQLDVLMCDASLPQRYSKFVGALAASRLTNKKHLPAFPGSALSTTGLQPIDRG
jgi:hypothetical protein